MAGPVEDSKIMKPVMHKLSHLATNVLGVYFCNEFDRSTLKQAFENIKSNVSFARFKNSKDPWVTNVIRAQKQLLFIPEHLRNGVMEEVRGLRYAARQWQHRHGLKDGDCVFYWRSDGTIDGMKTAEHLASNVNIDIKKRFFIACKYCVEESVKSLLAQMNTSGETKYLPISSNSMVRFWFYRMCRGFQGPWKLSARRFFQLHETSHMGAIYSTFFTSLRPQERKVFLPFLKDAENDDYLLCVRAMTKEEEDQILKESPLKLLYALSHVPLSRLFLQTVEKMWKYIDEFAFHALVKYFLDNMNLEDFDLFEGLWNRSPIHLKESVEQIPEFRERIDSCFNEMRRKRKASFDHQEISKAQLRKKLRV